MVFLKKCGRSCVRTILGCAFMIIVALSISSYVELYLKADVMEDFIQDYFELTDQNTSEMSKILIKYRDETKYIKQYRKMDYPDTNSYVDVINSLTKKKLEDLDDLEDILEKQLKKVKDLQNQIKEDNKKLNKKANQPIQKAGF